MNTFKHSLPHENVEALVKIVNSVHEKRMVEGEEEPFVVTEDDFEELIKRLEKKNKRSYDFLTKTGSQFKSVVFKLCRRLIEAEKFPHRFFETVLHQFWKKKFPKEELGNHRLEYYIGNRGDERKWNKQTESSRSTYVKSSLLGCLVVRGSVSA